MSASKAELYQALFLDNDGHIGYEPFARNLRYFGNAGFQVARAIGVEKGPFLAMSAITKLSQWPSFAGKSFRIARLLDRRPFNYGYMALLRAFDIVAGPWLPQEWSRVALVVCIKP
jgi:hypothetical protein